ncbi:hypothetical protein ACVLD2_002619 [Paenibacillus sp. PvR052]|nr:hypothetical protein [Paenibacillus sp. PvP091]MBP1172607.1 hypothetical protein [Paenibacillus sp. PvR098]MBP2438987.1 hypothetical protein [Paenibacillus sp. PvP052]
MTMPWQRHLLFPVISVVLASLYTEIRLSFEYISSLTDSETQCILIFST